MICSQANEICTNEKKSTIVADHVIRAMKQLSLEDWVPALEQALIEYKDSSKSALCSA
jgi:hypothetical protein